MSLAGKRLPYRVAALVSRFGYRAVRRLMLLSVTHLIDLDCEVARARIGDALSSENASANRRGSSRGPVPEAEYRFLSAEEVRLLAADGAYDLPGEMADRLLGDYDFCYAAIVDGNVVSYSWFAIDSIEETHNSNGDLRSGVAMSFGSDVGYRYKGFTLVEARGQGFNQQVTLRGAVALADRVGVRRIITTIDWTNLAALRSCYASGHRFLGRIWRFGWGENNVYTIWPHIPSLNVQFDHQAVVSRRREPAPLVVA